MENLKIIDNSGDREFFTILPNYILNHSNAIDRAVYSELKRFAGENGNCFATEKTIMKRLKIGKKKYDLSIKYLIEKKWIEYVGMTGGKTRPIKTYKVLDIWKINSDFYKKISSKRDISPKDISQKKHMISAESNIEEDITKEDIYRLSNDNQEQAPVKKKPNKDIDDLILYFKETLNLKILDGSDKMNRRFAWLALKKFKNKETIQSIIQAAAQSDFWQNKVTDFKALYYQGVKIVASLQDKKNKWTII